MKILIRSFVIVLFLVTFSLSTVWAGSVTIPNTFVSNTPALAAEVNANFTAVETAVDDNDARITTLSNAMPAAKSTTKTSTTVLSGTITDITSLTVTPPADGFILVIADGVLEIDGTGTGSVQDRIYLTTVSGGTSTSNYTWLGGSEWATVLYRLLPFSITRLFSATSGVSQTFYMTGNETVGATEHTAYVRPASLTALFIPNSLP